MFIQAGHGKHSSRATMFSLVTSLHILMVCPDHLLKFNDIGKQCAEQ